jgi:glycerate-2-kinase
LKEIASGIFFSGISSVNPEKCVEKCLRLNGKILQIGNSSYDLDKINSLYVIGFGKASAAMARPVEALLENRIDDGLIITKYGHGVPLSRCRVMEAGHPVPDANGIKATESMLDLVASANFEDLVLCLISGGGSALTPAPVVGINLSDKQTMTRSMLSCGATIHEVNTVRKHLSRVKGGQLCRWANGAKIVSLILSDVIGDDLDIIASGATSPDASTFKDSLDILATYKLMASAPASVVSHITKGCRGQVDETPKPGATEFEHVKNIIVGSLSDALNAAAKKARQFNFNPLILSSTIHGEATEVAKVIASIANEVRRSGNPVPPPACLLSGGETTVTIRGKGLGGRNMELALSAALELAEVPRTMMLSAGTDGTDGPTDAAGAFADDSTVSRAASLNLAAHQYLAQNNSYPLFQKLGDLFVTGPTLTNVMDLQIILIDK